MSRHLSGFIGLGIAILNQAFTDYKNYFKYKRKLENQGGLSYWEGEKLRKLEIVKSEVEEWIDDKAWTFILCSEAMGRANEDLANYTPEVCRKDCLRKLKKIREEYGYE